MNFVVMIKDARDQIIALQNIESPDLVMQFFLQHAPRMLRIVEEEGEIACLCQSAELYELRIKESFGMELCDVKARIWYCLLGQEVCPCIDKDGDTMWEVPKLKFQRWIRENGDRDMSLNILQAREYLQDIQWAEPSVAV